MPYTPPQRRRPWQAAALARERHDAEVASIRADTSLSPQGKQRRLAAVARGLRDELARLRADDRAAMEARSTELERRIFGVSWEGARDAELRAQAVTDLDGVRELAGIADRLGDRGLAQAVAHRAAVLASTEPNSQRVGEYWKVVSAHAARHGLADELQELCMVDDELFGQPDTMTRVEQRITWYPPVLDELRNVNLDALTDALADAAGPGDTIPPSTTQVSVDQFLRSQSWTLDPE